MFSKVHNSKWIEWRKIVELNFLLINYDYLFVIFCDRIKYKATKKIFIRGWKLINAKLIKLTPFRDVFKSS